MKNKLIEILQRRDVSLYENYLNNGTYIVNARGDKIYNLKSYRTERTFKDIEKIHPIKKLLFKILHYINKNKRIIINSDDKKFNGDCLIYSSSNDHVKIIDDTNNMVLTIYNNKSSFKRIIDNIDYLKSIGYNIPDILVVDKDNNYIIEKKINNKEYNDDIVVSVIKSYISTDFAIVNSNIINTTNNLINKYQKNIKIPAELKKCSTIKCHGDLWSSNILFDGKSILYIDYENVGSYIFYYDIFHFIFSELYLKNNSSYIKKYFEGEYDYLLEKLFKKYSVLYSSRYREDYMNYFVYLYMTNKWNNISNRKIKKELKKVDKIYFKRGY